MKREEKLDHAARHRLRQEKAPSVLNEIRGHILATRQTVLPGSKAGQACKYTLTLWEKLTRFLEHPELELSNNLAENSMRPVALGRSNWIHIGSSQAGPRVAAIRLSDIRWTSKIEDGDPATVIEWAAMHEQSELIMMPTRGLGRFRRMLLGSVAAKVIHDVDCPVFTSAHEPFSPMSSQGVYRSILCAARFDPESEATLKMARFLADIYRARVCLLYIHSSSDARSEDEATQFIRHAFEQTGADGLDSSESTCVRILDASVSEGIRQTAIEKEADLLIVGRRHFRGDVSWIWSSLYTIICESPCPVLTV